ncbi:MAG: SCO family protein [Gammaproteobacteria bacterium]|nr:SCO family protein [Gammaproteobacteria bacterium]
MSPNSTNTESNSRSEQPLMAPGGSAPGKLRIKWLLWSLLGVVVLVFASAIAWRWLSPRNGQTALAVIGVAPHYRLVNQNGKPVSSRDFSGKIQIVTALFPYCRELCPLVAANLAEFRDNVVQASDLKGHVVFVFFNLAPADADPAEMRTFLKQYGWNSEDPELQFLTGSPEEIRRVVQGGYHIAYYRTPGEADVTDARFQINNPLADRVKPGFDIVHADTIEIVDGQGRIRKVFSEGARLDDNRLQSTIEPLLAIR